MQRPLHRADHRAWIEFASNMLGNLYMMKMSKDEESYNRYSGRLIEQLYRVENRLGEGPWFNGADFSLADTAFAYSCNSRNERAVAAGASIEFLAPAHAGDLLTAEGVEQHRAGRTGVYDMRVTDQNGKVIALFRGKSAVIRGHYVEDHKEQT